MRVNRVKELRQSMHLSQEKLSEYTNISQQVISKIERNDSRLTKENMIILADFFSSIYGLFIRAQQLQKEP